MNKPPLIWTNVLVFSITFLVAVIGVPYYAIVYGFDSVEVIATLCCMGFCTFSITAGYHRLWSHKAYEANAVVRFIFAIGGAFAIQNSILHWASDHRIHHLHVDDNDKDPYSAKRGFWFSHIGWMIRDYQPHRYADFKNCADLKRDKIVLWQHKYYLPLVLLTNFGIPILLGWLNGNILAMVLLAGFFRLVYSHHTTFFINSLAHIWGSQPYTDKNTARDNTILALFTGGEGYHNFHHIFAFDYRNGVRWWQFDPTKWMIKTLSIVGLTKNLRRTPEDRIVKARAQMLLKRTSYKLQTMKNAEELKAKLQKEYEILIDKVNAFYLTRKKLLELKKQALTESYERSELAQKYKELKLALAEQKRQWQMFNAQFA